MIKRVMVTMLLVGSMLSQQFSLGQSHHDLNAVGNDIYSSSVPSFPVVYNSEVGAHLFDEIGRYQLSLIGNSNTLGYDRGRSLGKPYYEYIDVDDDDETYNSTSMEYVKKGIVKKAFLYIAQSYEVTGLQNATRDEAFILGPKGNKFIFDEGYQDAYYDITDFVVQEGEGSYWGKNIDSERVQNVNRDNFANWEILIVEENPTFDYRNVVVDGFHIRMQYAVQTISSAMGSIPMARTDISGQTVLSSAGGNQTLQSGTGDIISLQGGVNIGQEPLPSGVRGSDLLQGRITNNGVDLLMRNPNDIPTNIDLITQDLPVGLIKNGAEDVQFSLTTYNDIVFLHMFGISVDVEVPTIEMETFFGEPSTTSQLLNMGEDVLVNNTIAASPDEDRFFLANPYVEIQLPVGTMYKPNSIISLDNQVVSETYDVNTGELVFVFSDTITNNTFDFSYELSTFEGVRVSDINSQVVGTFSTQAISSIVELTFDSNDVTLYPSYPVQIQLFDERDGSVIHTDSIVGNYGEAYTVFIPTIEGFTFNPYANNSPLDGVFIDAHQFVDLYFTANEYTLDFDINGGQGVNPDSQVVTFNQLATAVTNPSRTGFTFAGWNTSQDGSGTSWNFASSLMPASDVTLYAQWTRNNYDLSFNVNGGDTIAPPTQSIPFEGLASPVTNPTKVGHTFVGWNSVQDGSGLSWNFNTTTMPANNVTLYAQWSLEPIATYALSFDLNGGNGLVPSDQILNEGELATAPTDPTREGYSFVGWNTLVDGSGLSWNFNTTTMPANDVTLYAKWSKKELPDTGVASSLTLTGSVAALGGLAMLSINKREDDE